MTAARPRVRLPTEIEQKLQACEQQLRHEIADIDAVAEAVEDITTKVESGEIVPVGGVVLAEVDDDPSLVRHITELKREVDRERRESPGVAVLLGTVASARRR